MSKVGQLIFQIQDMVEQGHSPAEIAWVLDCPIEWAEQAWEDRELLERDMMNYYSQQDA